MSSRDRTGGDCIMSMDGKGGGERRGDGSMRRKGKWRDGGMEDWRDDLLFSEIIFIFGSPKVRHEIPASII